MKDEAIQRVFRDRAKQSMEALGIDQKGLALAAKCSEASVCRYLNADPKKARTPGNTMAVKIAQALGVSLDWLFGLTEEKTPEYKSGGWESGSDGQDGIIFFPPSEEQLNKAVKALESCIDTKVSNSGTLGLLLDLLLKETPRGPERRTGWPQEGRDTADGYCPRCGNPLVCVTPRYYSTRPFYCQDCGQLIDWNADERKEEE